MVPNYRIHDTALGAALATLGIARDPTNPYDRLIDTDTGREQIIFLFRGVSDTDATRKTEDLIAAWENRSRFEASHPSHPLVAIRAAHDARNWLIKVIHGAELQNAQFRGERFGTPHLFEAAVLRAHGFPLLFLTGREFSFPAVVRGVAARGLIAESQREHGQAASQWQAKFLVNLSTMLTEAKCVPRLVTRDGDRALLLRADAPKKIVDQFHDEFY